MSEPGRAARLWDRITKVEKILVILDDLWERLDLEAVGIPVGDDHLGCKVLLTSRSPNVLSGQMDTDKNFSIETLSDEEAQSLFKEMMGDFIEDPGELQSIATDLIKHCAGLPVAIVTVAKALKNKKFSDLKDALQQITSAPEMQSGVHSTLELSYNQLGSVELKALFLLCGLYPYYNISIRYLTNYAFGLGWFQNVNTLAQASDRVHELVHNLKASSLLLKGDSSEQVKMHDIVRDVAISIAGRDRYGFTAGYVGFKEWPKDDVLQKCTAISLSYCDTNELPEGLVCPELELFLLYSNNPSLKIPDTFFESMKKLKVLDLTEIHFTSLPSSLHSLTNLRTLCLDNCMLGDNIAFIGKLINLEILSFVGSDIVELPRELGQLTHLQLLDLSNCSKLKSIPANVISSLSRLEELHLKHSFVEWEIGVNERSNASLIELKNLSYLNNLRVLIPDLMLLPEDLHFENLVRYTILIGDKWDWSVDYEISRTLKLKLNATIHMEYGVKTLLNRTEGLYLDELRGIKHLVCDFDNEGFPNLKHLHVQNSVWIQSIINSMGWSPPSAFPILESLFLKNLNNLEKVCYGQPPAKSFSNLRVIKVEHCNKLRNLFSFSVARGLEQLQEIEISQCKIINEIVGEERKDDDNHSEAIERIVFPRLHFLTLQGLLELTGFCSNVETSPAMHSRGERLLTNDARSSEGKLGSLMSLFNEKVAFQSLESLKLSQLHKLKAIWHGQLAVESFSNLQYLWVENCSMVEKVFDPKGLNVVELVEVLCQLTELNLSSLPSLRCIWSKDSPGLFLGFKNLKWLKVQDCKSLKNLFTPSMAQGLLQLQGISVKSCEMIEEIVSKEQGPEEEAMSTILFPLLTHIELGGLPNLKTFYPGSHTLNFPSLKILTIAECAKMKAFTFAYQGTQALKTTEESLQETLGQGNFELLIIPFFNIKVSLPHLETFSMLDMQSEKLWQDQLPAESFCKLKSLKVMRCHGLSNIVPYCMLKRLQNLETLMVEGCSSLEDIFELKELNVEERHAATATELRYSYLQNLSSLIVVDCHQLKHLLTTSLAKSLEKLRVLRIDSCKMMEEIITKKKGAEEVVDKMAFPRVISLSLAHLPVLKNFCQGIYTTEWPSLNKLEVICCGSVEILASRGVVDAEIQQPLFMVGKDSFANLKELRLEYNDCMEKIWQGQIPEKSFCRLRVIKVVDCFRVRNSFPISLLQRLRDLPELTIQNCRSLEEVYEVGRLVGEATYAAKPTKLRELTLENLPKLMHLWKEDSRLNPIFQNLTTLKVWYCGSLVYLLPCKITKSLVQLKYLGILRCGMMKEIVGSSRGEETEEITFSNLTTLEFSYLANLTSFCSESHAFKFPSLETVLLRGCPRMKTFGKGIISTPKLEKVQAPDIKWFLRSEQKVEWLWKGDLNTTTQFLFKNMNVQISEED